MRLVYLSPVPWASFAQRPHKFVEWFHARSGGDVLWVDPYPTRLMVLEDLRRLRAGGGITTKQGANTETPAWITIKCEREEIQEFRKANSWEVRFDACSILH